MTEDFGKQANVANHHGIGVSNLELVVFGFFPYQNQELNLQYERSVWV